MDRFPKNISFSRSTECHNNNHSYDDAGDGGEEIFCFLTLFLLSFSDHYVTAATFRFGKFTCEQFSKSITTGLPHSSQILVLAESDI